MRFWFVTTFANTAWDSYAHEGLVSLAKYLPQHIKICVGLDDDALLQKVKNVLEADVPLPIFTNTDIPATQSDTGDAKKLTSIASHPNEILVGRDVAHREFLAQFSARDVANDYRRQATRFCHKIFFLKRFFDKARAMSAAQRPDFVVWWDADAQLTRPVREDEILGVMPGAAQACSYLGRKDWDHSECGFMGFAAAQQGAADILDFMVTYYVQGLVFSLPQWHDSYLFDVAREGIACKNISEGVPGNNVWAQTQLGQFSQHWKGPQAKARKKALTDAELFGDDKRQQ